MRVSLMMITLLLCGIVSGYELGVFPAISGNLGRAFTLNIEMLSFVAAALPFAAAVGAVCSGFLSDAFGRRVLLLAAIVLFLLGIFESAICESINEFILGRFLLGLAVGIMAVNVPLYLIEVSPAEKRGQWIASYFVSLNMGVFLACLLGAVIASHQHWRLVLMIASVPVVLLFVLCYQLPESPRWLILNGQQGRAGQILINYFGSKSAMSIINKMDAVHHRSIYQKTTLWSANGIRLLLLGVLVNIFVQAIGIHAIVTYATLLMEKINIQDHFIEVGSSLSISIILMLAAILASSIIDHMHRRKLLLLGLTGMIVALVLISWSLHAMHNQTMLRIVVLFGCLLFIGSQGFSLAPLASLLPAEIFPQSLRGVGMGISISAYWVTNMIIVYGFERMLSEYGASVSFLVFLGFALIAFVWSYFNIPETAQIPLEKLEKNFLQGSDNRDLGVDEDEFSELGLI